MFDIKTSEEIEKLKEGGKILAHITENILENVKEGATSHELNEKALNLFRKNGGRSSFLNYKPRGAKRPFPSALCVSVNDEVVHGIANEEEKVFKGGDIVGVDLGFEYKGFFTDIARSKIIGEPNEKSDVLLLEATKKALQNIIDIALIGAPVWKLGEAVEKAAAQGNFGVVEVLGGHGVGRAVHEYPFIPNYAERDFKTELKEGMVIAVEPMLNKGTGKVYLSDDGWTFKTADGKNSAHFEDTLVITDGGPEIITRI